MAETNGTHPKYTLYTSHYCPWAHRAHIALDELKVPYEEVIIDLSKPREDWYLKINPRGLVPALAIHNSAGEPTIICESAIIAQFVADAHPSGFSLPSSSAGGALARAQAAFFVDTYFSKVRPKAGEAMDTEDPKVIEEKMAEYVVVAKKELEGLLPEKGPFFGGKNIGMAEALIGPFLLRLEGFTNAGVVPGSFPPLMAKETPKFSRWAEATCKHPSVRRIWKEDLVIPKTLQRLREMREKKKASGK